MNKLIIKYNFSICFSFYIVCDFLIKSHKPECHKDQYRCDLNGYIKSHKPECHKDQCRCDLNTGEVPLSTDFNRHLIEDTWIFFMMIATVYK